MDHQVHCTSSRFLTQMPQALVFVYIDCRAEIAALLKKLWMWSECQTSILAMCGTERFEVKTWMFGTKNTLQQSAFSGC